MTIQEAITKAIEGGWKKTYISSKFPNGIAEITGYVWSDIYVKGWRASGEIGTKHWNIGSFNAAFLDPLFWQSLGKAMGWTGKAFYEDGMTLKTWKREWHHFIDKLADGGTPEQFFEELKG